MALERRSALSKGHHPTSTEQPVQQSQPWDSFMILPGYSKEQQPHMAKIQLVWYHSYLTSSHLTTCSPYSFQHLKSLVPIRKSSAIQDIHSLSTPFLGSGSAAQCSFVLTLEDTQALTCSADLCQYSIHCLPKTSKFFYLSKLFFNPLSFVLHA